MSALARTALVNVGARPDHLRSVVELDVGKRCGICLQDTSPPAENTPWPPTATSCRHVSRDELVKDMGCGRRDFLAILHAGSAAGVQEGTIVLLVPNHHKTTVRHSSQRRRLRPSKRDRGVEVGSPKGDLAQTGRFLQGID